MSQQQFLLFGNRWKNYFTDRDERRVFQNGSPNWYWFRWPWSKLMSVKQAKELGFFQ